MKAIILKIHKSNSMRFTQGLLVLLSFLIVLGFASGAVAYTTNANGGGDCATRAGVDWQDIWDQGSSTCTLGADLSGFIVIESSKITLDGNGKTLTGVGGSGVSIQGPRGTILEEVTVRDLTIQGFNIGIYLFNSKFCKIYNNNFINNDTHATVDGVNEDNKFFFDSSIGGNYWDNNQNCDPAKVFCDSPYLIYNNSGIIQAQDDFPWTKPDGWKTPTTALDIKPGSCNNPVNVKSKGVLPVVVLGSSTFDVGTIDLESLMLAGVAPIRSMILDVLDIKNTTDTCDELGGDGIPDLVLKFRTQKIVDALGDVVDGDFVKLHLTLLDNNGNPIDLTDTIFIIKKDKKDKEKKK
ncbi:MAG: NosD domain-containing protein [Desulfobacterales bacterium]|nr:NosD domain-containing protein [Desulfobacterales bacterium]